MEEIWSNYFPVMGGTIHTAIFNFPYIKAVINQSKTRINTERFRRPSKQLPLANKFSFEDFEKDDGKTPLITTVFDTSKDVVMAYFGILENASSMVGYWGGCGSIGNSLQPYPYAYELYTAVAQKKMPLSKFINSFKGIGHITLLKLYPAYIPPRTPANIQYYMFETEVITGPSEKDEIAYKRGGSYFAYYYGLITIENNPKYGWKIQSIDYLPENFLCAPEHGWVYLSQYFVRFVYQDWYQLIDKIDHTEQNGDMIILYASGGDKKYRFDFVRLTNGYDILLHENVWINGKWEETNILKEEHQGLKLSILNPNLKA